MDFEENKIKTQTKAKKKLNLNSNNHPKDTQPKKRGFFGTIFHIIAKIIGTFFRVIVAILTYESPHQEEYDELSRAAERIGNSFRNIKS